MPKADEQVLVIPRTRFEAAGTFHGFRPFDAAYQALLMPPGELSFRPRSLAETDPAYKQLIPYVLLRHGARFFEYVRGKSGGETRLHHRRSVGIGGHIASTDGDAAGAVYRVGMLRELHEEVDLRTAFAERPLGFIYDGRTPVGEVHLGIVHVLDLEAADVAAKEDGIADGRFTELAELLTRLAEFETWSQFALQAVSMGDRDDDK